MCVSESVYIHLYAYVHSVFLFSLSSLIRKTLPQSPFIYLFISKLLSSLSPSLTHTTHVLYAGCYSLWSSWHRQDAARARHRWPSGRAVLFGLWLGISRNVRGRGSRTSELSHLHIECVAHIACLCLSLPLIFFSRLGA